MTPSKRNERPQGRARPRRGAASKEDHDRRRDLEFERKAAGLGPDLADELRRTSHRKLDAAHFMLEALGALKTGDAERAHQAAGHAKAAGERSPAIRELLGVTAYRAGHYKEAMTELQAFRRMTGGRQRDPVIADCYRAAGRPERALEFLNALKRADVGPREWAEAIVVRAGALDDIGDRDRAVVVLSQARLGEEAITPAGSLRPDVVRSIEGTPRRRTGTRSARRSAPEAPPSR